MSAMAGTPAHPELESLASLGAGFWAPVATVAIASVVFLHLADGNLVIAAVPVLLTVLGWAMWKLPLRITLFSFMFIALAVEGPISNDVPTFGEAFSLAGQLVLMNLNIITKIGPLAFCTVDALTVFAVIAIWYRKSKRSRIDLVGQFQTPTPLAAIGVFTFVGTVALFGLGILRGGDFRNSLWQVHVLLYVPALFLLFQSAVRGPLDHAALGKVVLAAAILRAGLVLFIAANAEAPIENAATSHSDSVLFAVACTVLIARFNERPSGRHLTWCVVLLPIFFAAMVANNRRLVWVELAAALLTLLLISPWTKLKRAFAYGALLLSPIILPYLVIGWNAKSKIFAPVQVLASMASSRPDASTVMRDIENYNLLKTLKLNGLFGIGWGHPYVEFVGAIDISRLFPQYRYLPHNGLLGLWAFNGLFGFFILFALPVAGVFFAARAYHRARRPDDRAAALCVAATVACHLVQCFGDIGTSSWTSVFLLGPALAVAGKLAVATGAWPTRLPRKTVKAPPTPVPLRAAA